MNDVEIMAVDERDSSWEEHEPRFRVYLHHGDETSPAGATATYDVTGADVLQVIDWAQVQAGDERTYAVALVRDDRAQEALDPGHGRGLVWLVGIDGNDLASDEREADAQRRMLARRRNPVIVPIADRMPADLPDPDDDGTAPNDG